MPYYFFFLELWNDIERQRALNTHDMCKIDVPHIGSYEKDFIGNIMEYLFLPIWKCF